MLEVTGVKYVLLFCGTDEDAAAFAALSEVELKERYALVGRWFAEHRSRIGGSNQLLGPETATSVRFGRVVAEMLGPSEKHPVEDP